MSRRAPAPNRAACEAALSPEDLVVLRSMATYAGVPTEGWHLVPSLARVWGLYAVGRLAERFRERCALSREDAQARAASEIGVSEETVRSLQRRFFRDAHGL